MSARGAADAYAARGTRRRRPRTQVTGDRWRGWSRCRRRGQRVAEVVVFEDFFASRVSGASQPGLWATSRRGCAGGWAGNAGCLSSASYPAAPQGPRTGRACVRRRRPRSKGQARAALVTLTSQVLQHHLTGLFCARIGGTQQRTHRKPRHVHGHDPLVDLRAARAAAVGESRTAVGRLRARGVSTTSSTASRRSA